MAACRDAWAAGLETPDPRPYSLRRPSKRARVADVPPERRTFTYAAGRWVEDFEQQHRGGPERKRDVQRYIRRHIQPYLDQCGVELVSEVTQEVLVDFASYLAGQHLVPASTGEDDPLDRMLVTRQQLLERSPRSRSTVQRALGTAVPVAGQRDDGRPLYSLGAARRAGLLALG